MTGIQVEILSTPVVLFTFFLKLTVPTAMRVCTCGEPVCYGANEKWRQTPKLVLIVLLCKGLNRTSSLGIE